MNNGIGRSSRRRYVRPIAALGAVLASAPAVALQCHVGTITYYPEGGIKSCEIEANHEFRTMAGASLVCRGGALLAQHPDGSIESCTLATPYAAGSARCKAGARVVLDPGGDILDCE